MRDLAVVVLAAGKGTRMRNDRPKVLHPLAGVPLLAHVLTTARALAPARLVVVVGHGAAAVTEAVGRIAPEARVVRQEPQRGTGHAVQAALPALPATGTLLVLYGDTPLLRPATLRRLLETHRDAGAAVTLLAIRPADPAAYGRIRLDAEGRPVAIVEARHAPPELLASDLCNGGVMALDLAVVRRLLPDLRPHPEKGEIYLTDLVARAVAAGSGTALVEAPFEEGLGANAQAELVELERRWQRRRRAELLAAGVVMPAPETVHLAADTEIAPGAVVEPYVVFGPGVRIGAGARVRSFSHLEGVRVEAGAEVGPFARLRPGSLVAEGAKVGNFVELKNARLGPGAKANHLSYLGDAEVGAGANIGAGTITCNYDGVAKHPTHIGADAFVGSNSALVAPVRVGRGAIVGAGSVITRDVPEEALAVARGRQEVREGMAPVLRERFRHRRATAGSGAGSASEGGDRW